MKLVPDKLPPKDRSAIDCAIGLGVFMVWLFWAFTCTGVAAFIGKEDNRWGVFRRAAIGFGACSALVLIPAAPILVRVALRRWSHSSRSHRLFGQSTITLLDPVAEGQPFAVRLVQQVREPMLIDRVEVSLAFLQHFEWQSQDRNGEPDILPKYQTDRLWMESRTCLTNVSVTGPAVIEVQESFGMAVETPLREEADRRYEELRARSYFLDAGPRHLFWRVHIQIVLADGFVFESAYRLVPTSTTSNGE